MKSNESLLGVFGDGNKVQRSIRLQRRYRRAFDGDRNRMDYRVGQDVSPYWFFCGDSQVPRQMPNKMLITSSKNQTITLNTFI